MRGGKLRRRVDIQSFTSAQNGRGEMIPTWSNFATSVPAEILANNGREAIQGGQVNAQQPVIIHMRYMVGVLPKMRVIYGTRTFEIQSVANLNERNREIELTCVEHQ